MPAPPQPTWEQPRRKPPSPCLPATSHVSGAGGRESVFLSRVSQDMEQHWASLPSVHICGQMPRKTPRCLRAPRALAPSRQGQAVRPHPPHSARVLPSGGAAQTLLALAFEWMCVRRARWLVASEAGSLS